MSDITRLERKIDLLLRLQGLALDDLEQILADEPDDAAIAALTVKLKASAASLDAAVQANRPSRSTTQTKEAPMANPILDTLAAQVQANTDAEASATTLINGFAARVQAAITAALAGGATAAELAPIQAEVDALKASAAALAAAVVANTPVQAKP